MSFIIHHGIRRMRATTISTSCSHGLMESVDKGRRVTDGCGKTNCSRRIGGERNAAADLMPENSADKGGISFASGDEPQRETDAGAGDGLERFAGGNSGG